MSAEAMKLNMIVVITTWLPRRACSQPGMNAQKPPNSGGREHRERHHEQPRQPAEIEADEGDTEAADDRLGPRRRC